DGDNADLVQAAVEACRSAELSRSIDRGRLIVDVHAEQPSRPLDQSLYRRFRAFEGYHAAGLGGAGYPDRIWPSRLGFRDEHEIGVRSFDPGMRRPDRIHLTGASAIGPLHHLADKARCGFRILEQG